MLFGTAEHIRASALILAVGQAPMVRFRGDIRRLDVRPLTDDDMQRLLHDIMSDDVAHVLEKNGSVDFTHVVGKDECKFRCRVSKQQGQFSLYARMLGQATDEASG
jgi:twitching motility protein PilT